MVRPCIVDILRTTIVNLMLSYTFIIFVLTLQSTTQKDLSGHPLQNEKAPINKSNKLSQ